MAQTLRNMITIILDTDNKISPIQIGKFEPPTEDMTTTMALDITTVCEAAALLVKVISKETGKPREEILRGVMTHIKVSSMNNNVAEITPVFEENKNTLKSNFFSQN